MVVEAADEAAVRALPAGPNTRVTWLGAADHSTPAPGAGRKPWDTLADAVRAMPLPEGRGYAWGGGESRALTALRRYLRKEVGMAREQVSLVAYWRLALDGAGPDDDLDDDDQ